ncbi:MAG: T9SS type A sorting domain-containing protein [Endomicrobia bacterium]|nr:T9SS type A sorting domain-containing protein [Endomicrobiia bacterium]
MKVKLSLIRHSSFVIRNCREGFFFSLALVLFLGAQCFVSDAYAAAPWPNDPDFLVGAAGHHGHGNGNAGSWSGYGSNDADIERQIHLVAEMGAKIYRMDGGFPQYADFVEKVITLCERYGIEVLLIGGRSGFVRQFKGRVKYYQVDNEIDVRTKKPGYPDGTDISHFWMSTDINRPKKKDKDGNDTDEYDDSKCLDIAISNAIQTIKVIRAEDPGAKVMINGTATNFALLDYAFAEFAKAGVDIDLIGWDWYSGHEGNREVSNPFLRDILRDGFNSVAKHMYKTYGKEVILCEYNMEPYHFDMKDIGANAKYVPFLPGNGNGKIDPFEEDNIDTLMGPYLVSNIQYLYNNRAENHIKGVLIYELITQQASSTWNEVYGITYSKVLTPTGRNYQILGPKVAYYHLQKLLGGGFVPIKRLNPSAALPEHTITACVIDEDTDGAILSSQEGGTVTGSGIYKENSVVTLTAAAKPGYEFLGWYRGGIRISKNPVYKFTAYEDANNGDRDSVDGKFVYEARYVFKGTYEGELITFPVTSKDGAKNTGMLTVPAKTFGANVKISVQQYSRFILAPAESYVRELSHTNIGAIIDAQGKPEKEMELRIPYNNSDITGMNEESLVISRYDEEKQVWVPLKSKADKDNKQIIAYVDKVSIYAIMGTANILRAFENMKYYPNPLQPSKGLNYSRMQFSNIPPGTHIKIYTMLGQAVRDLEADASGMAVWDGKNNAGEKAASGVYIVYMKDGAGNKKRIKIAVER